MGLALTSSPEGGFSLANYINLELQLAEMGHECLHH